jgi:hypothetical protein
MTGDQRFTLLWILMTMIFMIITFNLGRKHRD